MIVNQTLSYAAVITGDIVKSTRLSQASLDSVYAGIHDATESVRAWAPGLIVSDVNRFRGDGWQVLLGSPRFSLRACLIIRAHLKARSRDFETRAAVGIGAISHLRLDDLAASAGAAFRESGRLLEEMKASTRLAIRLTDVPHAEQTLPSIVFALCDEISHRWTQKQGEVMQYSLLPEPLTQESIGRALSPPVKQQTVANHILAGGGSAIERAIESFENWVDSQESSR
tara:strand:+ start:446 stop:1129 length:684 start_codon:yes stop_codon:yes gene_type:complete